MSTSCAFLLLLLISEKRDDYPNWQWFGRAYQFGWSVSQTASPGAIVVLQPGVQGAYGAGHVAVVEQLYSDGSVLASTMNWGANPYQVSYVHYYPGSGVTFIQR